LHPLDPVKDGQLLLDAAQQALQVQPGNGRWTQLNNQTERFKALGLLKDASLCVQSFVANGAASSSRLKTYDGKRFETLTDLPSDPDVGLNLSACFSAQNGDLWISGERGTAVQREKKWRTFLSNDKSTPEAGVAFAELQDGKIWAATADKTWEFDGRNWSAVPRGVDRIHGLVRPGDSGGLASHGGLLCF